MQRNKINMARYLTNFKRISQKHQKTNPNNKQEVSFTELHVTAIHAVPSFYLKSTMKLNFPAVLLNIATLRRN